MSEIIGLRGKWDKRFIKLAELVSTWSKDKTQVGAVIADERDGAIALGFNGFPAGIKDNHRLKDREKKNKMIIHAEENALRIAGNRARDATLYVFGKPICITCARMIVQAGISRIVCMNPEDERSEDWRLSGIDATKLFTEAHIGVRHYKLK